MRWQATTWSAALWLYSCCWLVSSAVLSLDAAATILANNSNDTYSNIDRRVLAHGVRLTRRSSAFGRVTRSTDKQLPTLTVETTSNETTLYDPHRFMPEPGLPVKIRLPGAGASLSTLDNGQWTDAVLSVSLTGQSIYRWVRNPRAMWQAWRQRQAIPGWLRCSPLDERPPLNVSVKH